MFINVARFPAPHSTVERSDRLTPLDRDSVRYAKVSQTSTTVTHPHSTPRISTPTQPTCYQNLSVLDNLKRKQLNSAWLPCVNANFNPHFPYGD